MTTVFTATLELSKIVQHTPEGTATGGSTTTLLDTLRREFEDYFDRGTIWFQSGTLASKTAEVLDWIPTTFTFVLPGGGTIRAGWQLPANNQHRRN